MMSLSARASRSLLTRSIAIQRPTLTRTFIPTAIRQADIVQDLYLKELKNYKPSAVKANDHEGQVKPWHAPAAPSVPDLGISGVQQDLATYESQAVEVEGSVDQADTASSRHTDDWFDEHLVFEEEPEAGSH